jgi:hypothetical protein
MLKYKTTKSLDLEIEKSPTVELLREKCSVLGNYVSDSPTQYPDTTAPLDVTTLRIPRKLKDKLLLALLSWYVDEVVGFLIRLNLEENWGAELKEVGQIVLTSKEFALAWFIIQDKWNEFDFFGNILCEERVQFISDFLEFKKMSRKKVKKYTGYCRGYRDSNHQGQKPLPVDVQPGTISYQEHQTELYVQDIKLFSIYHRITAFLEDSA